MKRQLKMLTDIAVAAAVVLVLVMALLPAGTEELSHETAEELSDEPAKESQSTPNETKDMLSLQITLETTAGPVKLVRTSETSASETTFEDIGTSAAPETTSGEIGTSAAAQTTTASPPQTAEEPKPGWTEQEAYGVMYVNTDGIYSREVAQIGSKAMRQYELNEAVTVVAVTDTDYYKLEDGTFIYADYLSDSETVMITAEQTEPPVAETEAESDTEVIGEAIPLSVQAGVQSMAMEMYNMVNEYRAQYGLPPLEWDYNSYPAAQIRASELLQYNSHTRPDGTPYSDVYSQLGYSPSSTGENIVYYYSTPGSALNTLINSPAHRDIILSTQFTHISIAYVYDANSYWGYYWVQEFTAL